MLKPLEKAYGKGQEFHLTDVLDIVRTFFPAKNDFFEACQQLRLEEVSPGYSIMLQRAEAAGFLNNQSFIENLREHLIQRMPPSRLGHLPESVRNAVIQLMLSLEIPTNTRLRMSTWPKSPYDVRNQIRMAVDYTEADLWETDRHLGLERYHGSFIEEDARLRRRISSYILDLSRDYSQLPDKEWRHFYVQLKKFCITPERRYNQDCYRLIRACLPSPEMRIRAFDEMDLCSLDKGFRATYNDLKRRLERMRANANSGVS